MSTMTPAALNGASEVAVSGFYSQVQVIDEDKQFSRDIDGYLKEVGIFDAGLNYHLISVFGSQSTGKSTLLNALFGTRFDVMDETRRKQTTKGIWMSRAKQDQVLIMDVEGTDGRERGEDQDFERKAALFALATSEVLIVNIWEHQVGLYQGANMGLLKTVFEVNLSLFSEPNKSLLLFVIRDHIGITPLENLAATLTADLNRIWDSLIKPPNLVDSRISDFFQLQFTTLPHKILQPDNFAQAVGRLSHRFEISAHDPNYVFEKEYHRNVPADGWSIYANNVWEQIELNKDLDLPTQQILVARFRCEEIAEQALEAFKEDIKPVQDASLVGEYSALDGGIGSSMALSRSKAIEIYDSQASRYASSVYDSKKKEMLAKMDNELAQLYSGYLTSLRKQSVAEFNQSTKKSLSKPNYKFLESVNSAKSRVIGTFTSAAVAGLVDGASLSYDRDILELTNDLEEATSRLRHTEAKKMTTRIIRNVSDELDDRLPGILKKPEDDLWDHVMLTFREIVDKTMSKYENINEQRGDEVFRYDLGIGGTDEEISSQVELVFVEAWKALYRKMREFGKSENLLGRLREIFEDKFKYDDHGIPRVWKPADNIDELYSAALSSTTSLIPLFATARLANGDRVAPDTAILAALEQDEEIDVDKFSTLLTEGQALQLQHNFKRIADSMYVDAKRSTIQSIRQVPLYFYLVTLALGWNEIVSVLRNPLFFLLLLIFGGFMYTVWKLNLLGPMVKVCSAAIDQALQLAKDSLRQFLEVGQETPRMATTTTAISSAGSGSNGTKKEAEEDIQLDELNERGELKRAASQTPGGF
ncbi:RHD3/Sey1 [Lipomyces oligophaga]|uniref:RHD3/Sey1 n=1 Tax=Lipomyces oligophaga TaxID=45792 RepID=UPI0034CF42E9